LVLSVAPRISPSPARVVSRAMIFAASAMS
jgi:hypothetical protein